MEKHVFEEPFNSSRCAGEYLLKPVFVLPPLPPVLAHHHGKAIELPPVECYESRNNAKQTVIVNTHSLH